jgi:hypothetical protein
VEEAWQFFVVAVAVAVAVAVEQAAEVERVHKLLQTRICKQDIFCLLLRSLDQYRIDETISRSNQERKVERHLLLEPTRDKCNKYLELTLFVFYCKMMVMELKL